MSTARTFRSAIGGVPSLERRRRMTPTSPKALGRRHTWRIYDENCTTIYRLPCGGCGSRSLDTAACIARGSGLAIPGSSRVGVGRGLAVGTADSGAFATVDLRIDGATGDVCVRTSFSALSGPIMMAHIHTGAVGANGPVLVTLPVTDAAVNGCVTVSPADS